ncbi:MAG: hypothetical protein HQK72_11725 [Desulfamplus sp.]|nr:hypothetical protein [Desulfamplus sp.]
MSLRFNANGYFSEKGVFGGKESQMCLKFDRIKAIKFQNPEILITLLESSGYEEMSKTGDVSKAPYEASITLSLEDAVDLSMWLVAAISEQKGLETSLVEKQIREKREMLSKWCRI